MDAVYAAGVLALLFLLVRVVTRQNDLFRVTIAGGKVTVERGRVPPSFLGDLRDVARHIDRGTVRAVKQDGDPRLVFSESIDERTAQRLRNAFAVDTRRKSL